MVPSRSLVLLMVVPLFLAVTTLVQEDSLAAMLATDGGIVALAALDAFLARGKMIEVRRSSPEVLSVGRRHTVSLRVRSMARRALRLQIHDDLFADATSTDLPIAIELSARGRTTVQYDLTPQRRGNYELGDHWVRYQSPLGLWLRQLRIPATSPVRVYPDVHMVKAYDLLARQDRELALVRATRRRGGETEFEYLRDYQRDDEFRSIDWKATARSRRIIVRQYQLESNQNVVFMLDAGRLMAAESAGLSLFDHALNATLMLSHVAARRGDHVGLLAFAERVLRFLPPRGGARATRQVIRGTFELHPRMVESDFEAAYRRLGTSLRKRSLVIVFTQVIDEAAVAELNRLIMALRKHLVLCVLFTDPEVEALAYRTGPAAGPTDLYASAAAAEVLSWRDRLHGNLRAAGAHVMEVRPDGLTPAVVNRYLEIKARQLL
jgi:uncharacterized protein (DUF58 family)